jgi:hypothetical protein
LVRCPRASRPASKRYARRLPPFCLACRQTVPRWNA